jgi:diguanylate cyclase (GGDEF)-like protein
VLLHAQRAADAGRRTPTDIYLLLSVCWAASVGYGTFISLMSGDWVSATLACLSAAAMVGGICFRNFSAPRLAAIMILVSLGPSLPGAALAGEPILYVVFLQVPLYAFAMTTAAFKLNKMLVATMRAERENDHRARHDALTGLTNRVGLRDAVVTRLSGPRRPDEALALLFLDLDGFKGVNDTYGHAAGDRLLGMVAVRLAQALRGDDVAARIGGDEFVVLADGLTAERALHLGRRLINAVASSYDLGGGMLARIGVSVGIAMAPMHGSDLVELLAAADAALYQAKSTGKARCCMAPPLANLTVSSRPQGESDSAAA